jgi:serine/threonine protein phosphatase PrpC
VHALFHEEGLRRTVEALKGMRLALLEKPLKVQEGQSELLRSMFEEIVRQKYQNAYQTTFVAVCLKREAGGRAGTVSVKAVGCGDSALFIFREDGELLYNNLKLEDEHDSFKHGSPFTAVLPDSYAEGQSNLLFDFEEYPADAHLLLCSDGLYDAFANFKEIRDWLHEHRPELKSAGPRDECLSELHGRLNRTKGDDDISFIWLHPAAEKAGEPKEEKKTEPGKSGKPEQGFFASLFAAISRWLGFRTQ